MIWELDSDSNEIQGKDECGGAWSPLDFQVDGIVQRVQRQPIIDLGPRF
jgi:hypothetical protein